MEKTKTLWKTHFSLRLIPQGRIASYDHGNEVLSPAGTLIFVQ